MLAPATAAAAGVRSDAAASPCKRALGVAGREVGRLELVGVGTGEGLDVEARGAAGIATERGEETEEA